FEVVEVFGWLTDVEFAEMLAMGNTLPGPIITKMAGHIGFMQAGVLGATAALIATIMPSLFMMLGLMGILMRYRESPQVKRLTIYVRPTVAVLLGTIALQLFISSSQMMPPFHLLIITISRLLGREKLKLHHATLVACALIYGAVFL
ncbi:MAG: chromate transporter, partial [Defluviitaleaceae bacterium]|nr:chromate transporter [Defluviitaleaceae bacterium]